MEIIDNSDGWEYNLTGIDRGKSEEKKISYLHDKIPIISYFKDDDDVSPIVPNNESDKKFYRSLFSSVEYDKYG